MYKQSKIVLLTLLLGVFVISSIHAEPYVGFGISRVDSSATNGSDTGDANGIMIYAGNRFDESGFEVSYSDLGDIDVPQTSNVISGNLLKIQATFMTTFSEEFNLLGKLGVAVPDIETNTGWSYNDIELAWAVGMNYQFAQSLAFRVEYEQYDDMDGLNLNLLTFSLNTNF